MIGIRAASNYPDIQYWDYNWRKNGGSSRMIEISKRGILPTGILRLCIILYVIPIAGVW